MVNQSEQSMRSAIEDTLSAHFGVRPEQASDGQLFAACAMLVREAISRQRTLEGPDGQKKQVHYLSMEFLLGRSLMKNAFNLGLLDALREALRALGRKPDDIFEAEPDAGLGNGGLGRLAACYMDSAATLGIPATGYCLCYELGIFRQKLENGGQTEQADVWLPLGESWLVPCYEDMVEVRFGGRVEPQWDSMGNYHADYRDYTAVLALPRDMLIAGYGCQRVNTLRLWEAKSAQSLDMHLFSSGKYAKSLEQRTMAEVITKILYPADDHLEGKALRIEQQYFFVSATAQCIVRRHLKAHDSLADFADYHAIQINDTHPTLIIPELMRIFMDDHGLGWDEAWRIVTGCVSYTNHTIMSEALETWPQGLIQSLLPRIWEILLEINRRWRDRLAAAFGESEKVGRNLVIHSGKVHMANLCAAACRHVNGVSALHGSILKNELFHDNYVLTPERFTYITNGIDHRRWLSQSNPQLHALLCELIGDGYLRAPEELCKLKGFAGDTQVLARLEQIKSANKARFAAWLSRSSDFRLNTDALLDVQVKRLHEYKRQLLCAMLITHLQQRIHDAPDAAFVPRSFIFGAKAAAGYAVAKRIIRLLCSLAADVNADPLCRGKLQVHFLENYRVSAAEILMPAAQISEQISTAGKEASGTGNMKLMANGAVTIGTLDGANVEMYARLGDENMFLFGLRSEDAARLRATGYDPGVIYASSPELRRVLDRFSQGFADGESYADLVSRLLYGGDEYLLLADFADYVACHDRMYQTICRPERRAAISLVNIAESGYFAADRAVAQYRDEIWQL